MYSMWAANAVGTDGDDFGLPPAPVPRTDGDGDESTSGAVGRVTRHVFVSPSLLSLSFSPPPPPSLDDSDDCGGEGGEGSTRTNLSFAAR